MSLKKIKPIKIKKDMKVSELVEEMSGAGFGAGKIAEASRILGKMFVDKECKVFLGVAGAMVPAGMKQVLLDMLDRTDVFVTTGANLTHDLIEALGECHYKGDEKVDDEKLHEQGIDRIHNVFMKNSVYEKLEGFFEEYFDELKDCKTIKEFLWKIGEILSRDFFSSGLQVHSGIPSNSSPRSFSLQPNPGTRSQRSLASSITRANSHHPTAPSVLSKISSQNRSVQSILVKCYEKKIPIFCPGIADSGIGLMVWGRIVAGKGETNIDVFADMKEIIDIAWTSKKNGVVYVGGGLPKNFIQQSLQFSKGADYGIQITTDRTESGGSSGAPLREGISWGKMQAKADFVDVFCDATIALPLVYGGME